MEHRNLEQRRAIKFCVKLGESASVTFEKLKQAYGEKCLSKAQVFRWHKSFLKGRKHVEDEPRSGRPSTSKTDENIDRVRALVRSDRRLTIRMISELLNLNKSTVHQIVTDDLNIRKNIQGDSKSVKDFTNATNCDEEENYETSKSTDIKIKVEPGLTDDMYQDDESKDDMYQDDESKDDIKDILAGCIRLKEEPDTDSMIDIENTLSIKQEEETSDYQNSPLTDIKIKTEPDLSEYDESNDYAM